MASCPRAFGWDIDSSRKGPDEHEAKRSMKLAQRLMKRHNLSQALLLKEREMDDQDVLKGGIVEVRVVNRKTEKPSLYQRWFLDLVRAVSTTFEVKSFKSVSRGCRCKISFYGIYTNCQLAGYAFKAAAERISAMQANYVPPADRVGVSTQTARLSYSLGIVRGLKDEAKAAADREEEARKRKLERAQSAQSKGEAYDESSDEGSLCFAGTDDDDDDFGSKSKDDPVKLETVSESDGAGQCIGGRPSLGEGKLKPDGPPSKSAAAKIFELERENQAAVVLANQNEKIQSKVLEEEGIKLSSGRKLKRLSRFDRSSFQKGEEDSKQIDLKQRAIADDWRKKMKKEGN